MLQGLSGDTPGPSLPTARPVLLPCVPPGELPFPGAALGLRFLLDPERSCQLGAGAKGAPGCVGGGLEVLLPPLAGEGSWAPIRSRRHCPFPGGDVASSPACEPGSRAWPTWKCLAWRQGFLQEGAATQPFLLECPPVPEAECQGSPSDLRQGCCWGGASLPGGRVARGFRRGWAGAAVLSHREGLALAGCGLPAGWPISCVPFPPPSPCRAPGAAERASCALPELRFPLPSIIDPAAAFSLLWAAGTAGPQQTHRTAARGGQLPRLQRGRRARGWRRRLSVATCSSPPRRLGVRRPAPRGGEPVVAGLALGKPRGGGGTIARHRWSVAVPGLACWGSGIAAQEEERCLPQRACSRDRGRDVEDAMGEGTGRWSPTPGAGPPGSPLLSARQPPSQGGLSF